LYLEHRDERKEKFLQEHEHGSSKCCDQSQGALCTNNILALECRSCTLASLVGGAGGRGVDSSGAVSKAERKSLVPKGQVLGNRGVVALSIGDIETGKVIGVQEEHVLFLVEVLETAGVVGELVTRVGGGSVAQEDALHLIGVGGCHQGVILHDIAVAGIGDKDKLSLREGLEDLGQKELADGKSGRNVGEVERTGIERSTGVMGVGEVHVSSGDLLGGGGQIVEMHVGQTLAPVGVDVGHVLPGDVLLGERVEQTLRRLVDLCDTEDIINITDNGETGSGYEVSGRVANRSTLNMCVETLDLVGFVSVHETSAIDRNKDIKVTLDGGVVWKIDGLVSTAWGDSTATAGLG
jgi:hypothetical protein